jgi:protein-tyrosine phosphatase
MREILPNQLWIGNAGDGRDAGRLLRAGIVAVISLAAEEPSPNLPRSMIYCHFPLVDGPQDDEGALDVAIQTVVSLLKNEVPSLVYCGAGMSRSPAVVAAALSIVQGGSPDEKLKEIVAGHPHDVSPHLWESVCKVFSETAIKRPVP